MWPSPADRPVIALVVPCYNEEVVFPHTLRELSAYLAKLSEQGAISEKSHICFIDDGSRDRTWFLIAEAAAAQPGRVCGLKQRGLRKYLKAKSPPKFGDSS
jgi:glycosyltransferase involved in cell wall biosynthesis